MVFWKNEMEKFYGKFAEGQFYSITEADIKPSNPSFNKTNHKYELTCSRTTQIDPIDYVPWLKKVDLNLSSLADVKSSVIKENLTCLVIVSSPAEETLINKKDG